MNATNRTYRDIETGAIYRLFEDQYSHRKEFRQEDGNKAPVKYATAIQTEIKLSNGNILKMDYGTAYAGGFQVVGVRYSGKRRFREI